VYNYLSLRATKTVEDGIVIDSQANAQRLIEYQPGNGTRYVVIFSDLTLLNRQAILALGGAVTRGQMLVTLATILQYRSALFTTVHPNADLRAKPLPVTMGEVYNKFGTKMGPSDAAVLAELIGWVLGRGSPTPEESQEQYAKQLFAERRETLLDVLYDLPEFVNGDEAQLDAAVEKFDAEINTILRDDNFAPRAAVQRVAALVRRLAPV